jgi:nitrile hydratase alpha subunit
MSHDHTHAPPRPDDPEPRTDHELLGVALSNLLIEKGIYSAAEERQRIEALEAVTPARGARVVARAWVDPEFKARLLTDARSAVAELGIEHVDSELTAVANTPQLHNVVVCTLCSCYPRSLLGRPPAWYKSKPYRARVVHEPRQVLAEFGTHIALEREIRVHDSTAELRYIVIPERPANTADWSEDELAAIVDRDAMVGVAEVTVPDARPEA